jgi:hypothetical protein
MLVQAEKRLRGASCSLSFIRQSTNEAEGNGYSGDAAQIPDPFPRPNTWDERGQERQILCLGRDIQLEPVYLCNTQ